MFGKGFGDVVSSGLPSDVWGARQKDDFCVFRVYCPLAVEMELELFDHYDAEKGKRYSMEKLDDGSWHLKIQGCQTGKYYGLRARHSPDEDRVVHTRSLLADPWSVQVGSKNHYRLHGKTRIAGAEPFDWQGDTFVVPEDPRELVIYETHLRDLTVHPSAGSRYPGSYKAMTERGLTGGIAHLKRLGVNAVEFLPLQKFAAFEPPYYEETEEGFYNTWNAYSRNHWGYMTSFFFAPETRYSHRANLKADETTGAEATAGREFKEMVRALHKEGITVIMDVVYNHTSQYDLNPLKYLCKAGFYRTDEHGSLTSVSGCGNDLRTEAEFIRHLIVASVRWWMLEYHVDGFRFDLAHMIDHQTLKLITREARKINPNVLLIAEPWGAGYNPTLFSELGWASWNDQIRNGVKGYDPVDTPGFIFGRWHFEASRESLENYVRGSLLHRPGGRFHRPEHAVNYLESHDGYTLADFIRIALDPQKRERVFSSRDELVRLGEKETRIARLAALYLFTSQGIPMIHSGQEWGRTKWIPPENEYDEHRGKLDHNSYEKDNQTNHLDYTEIDQNPWLFAYYCQLIRLRKQYAALKFAEHDDIHFLASHDALHLAFKISLAGRPKEPALIVVLNGHPQEPYHVELPEGSWEMLVNGPEIYPEGSGTIVSSHVEIPGTSGAVYRQTK